MKVILLLSLISLFSCSSTKKELNQDYKICLSQAKVMMEDSSLLEQKKYCKEEILKGRE